MNRFHNLGLFFIANILAWVGGMAGLLLIAILSKLPIIQISVIVFSVFIFGGIVFVFLTEKGLLPTPGDDQES